MVMEEIMQDSGMDLRELLGDQRGYAMHTHRVSIELNILQKRFLRLENLSVSS